MNREIVSEIEGIDYAAAAASVSGDISGRIGGSGSRGAVFGMSGGVDSAVIGYACAAAGARALALVMPDTSVTPEEETRDALQMARAAGLEHRVIDIRPIMSGYRAHTEPDERATGNLRARVRAGLLYHYANARGYLVAGSSDRSEYLMGYFTKFGDGACDFAPIRSLYKLQVRGLARHLGVPEGVVSKKSSPHLWEGHDAEGEIGMTYEEADSILYCMNERGLDQDGTARLLGIGAQKVARVWQLCAESAHKRE